MLYIQKNSMISLGSCFRPKNYDNCASMKLKWRGECDNEVKLKIEHESKLRIEIELIHSVYLYGTFLPFTRSMISLKNNISKPKSPSLGFQEVNIFITIELPF